MRGFRGGIAAAVTMAMVCMPMSMFAQAGGQTIAAVEEVARPSRAERRRRSSSFINADRRYRNRWKPDKPKRRANRLHVSRRVRRRHRRTA